ncbi:MAG: DegT/DnrJ/EryC1/StrS family aminotransferase [Hyphomicrobiales bacterium]|nr:DegT/DnrJ/EryC1/StrS family aminotransferase [Hyphomicrobiales bacterium]
MATVGFREWLAVGRAIAERKLLRYEEGARLTDRFEQRLADRIGARHVLTVTSGTNALICALAATGVGPGDEVLVPAYTWMATAAAPVMVGAVPVLVDIDESLTIDPKDIERKITPYTRAIIPVHMGNVPCDMDAIMRIADKHGLLVIEDACQAVGVRYKDRHCGAIGQAGALSFNRYKNINIGEGGAVITSDDRIFRRARNYHDLGTWVRGHNEEPGEQLFVGTNMRATEIEGAMLGVQLSKLGPMLKRLRKRRDMFASVLGKSSRFRISPHHDEANAVGLSVIFDRREEAIAFAKRRGVSRLQANSKHVYTNWKPILDKRTFHPALNPWTWAKREIDYDIDCCARTLDILDRTCHIALGHRFPMPAMRLLAHSHVR